MLRHVLVLAAFGSATASAAPDSGARSIVEFQALRREETAKGKGRRLGEHVRLINLNPAVNAWYLLELGVGAKKVVYNLENPHPREQRLHLDTQAPGTILITDYRGQTACELWTTTGGSLRAGAALGSPYVPLCEARLLLRNPADGHRSMKELAVDLLRDHIIGGEAITGFFKDTLFKDKYKMVAEVATAAQAAAAGVRGDGPRSAETARDGGALAPQQLGIGLAAAPGGLAPGRWYPAKSQAGVWVSEVSPSRLSASVLQSYSRNVGRLDDTEARAVAFLVAFDLDRFDVGFALGTDHPRVGWSERAAALREPGLPGPDGFSNAAPLVQSGMLNPMLRPLVVATMAGGFKRHHGAFKWGDLAKKNHGSHYGFIEEGVVFSKLQPGLATLFVKNDGTFGMKTWTDADRETEPQLRYARQNGVPLLEREPGGVGKPSAYVDDWARGNWSGSAEKKLRTLRSGLCLQRSGGRRYLVYGYFSTATPSSMTRVFQAYGCDYAMHLDMNAPEHTYMAVYHDDHNGDLEVEHLVKVMSSYDGKERGKTIPRFVGMPDNRDFVFLYKKTEL